MLFDIFKSLLIISHASVKDGIQLGGENEKRVRGLDKNFLISLCMAYFQLLDMNRDCNITKVKVPASYV